MNFKATTAPDLWGYYVILIQNYYIRYYAVLEFGGGCQGCGMVDVTLKDGIEKTLLDTLPELSGIKDMTDHSIDDHAYYKGES